MAWGRTFISRARKPNRNPRHDGRELSELTGGRGKIDRRTAEQGPAGKTRGCNRFRPAAAAGNPRPGPLRVEQANGSFRRDYPDNAEPGGAPAGASGGSERLGDEAGITDNLPYERTAKTNSSGPVARLERRGTNSAKSLVQGLDTHNATILPASGGENQGRGGAWVMDSLTWRCAWRCPLTGSRRSTATISAYYRVWPQRGHSASVDRIARQS